MKENLVSATSDHQVLVNGIIYQLVLTQNPVKQKDRNPNAPQKIEITWTMSIGDQTITQQWSQHWKPVLTDDTMPIESNQNLNLK